MLWGLLISIAGRLPLETITAAWQWASWCVLVLLLLGGMYVTVRILWYCRNEEMQGLKDDLGEDADTDDNLFL